MNKLLTYADLLEALQELTQEELQNTATIYVEADDEFYPIIGTNRADDDQSVLDVGHPYFEI
jgi:hypothetical protein